MMAWFAMFLALSLATPATGVTGVEGSTRTEKSEFQRRLKLIASYDEASAMQLAEWAERKHLIDEADNLYRDIIDRDPEQDTARRNLDRLAARRPLAVDSEAFLSTHSLLPPPIPSL